MSFLKKLLSISSAALAVEPLPEHQSRLLHLGSIGEELFYLLSARNGFYAFESALHVFPLTEALSVQQSLTFWNRNDGWKKSYGQLIDENMLCFAEDVFGGQFCIIDNGVFRFDPEVAELSFMAETLDDWARRIIEDYEVETGYPLVHAWQIANGELEPGTRLLPKVPFVIGGAFDIDNLFPISAEQGMMLRGDVALQIAALPDGTWVQIVYTAGTPRLTLVK